MSWVVLGATGILAAYVLAFFPAAARLAPWLMSGGVALLLTALLLRGASRRGRRLPVLLLLAIVIVGALVLAAFWGALALPPDAAGSPLWLGLPRRAALLIYGVGVLPALILPFAYALSFDAGVLSEAELAELRRRLADRTAEGRE